MQITALVLEHLSPRWCAMLSSLAKAVGGSYARLTALPLTELPPMAEFGLPPRQTASVLPLVSEQSEVEQSDYLCLLVRGPDLTLVARLELFAPEPAALSPMAAELAATIRDSIEDQLALYAAKSDPISELGAMRRALRISDQRFRLLVENALDDFFMHDDQGKFLDVSDRACRNHGYTRAEMLTMSASDLSSDLTLEQKLDLYRRTPPGAAATVHAHHTRKDGSVFPVEVLISCHLIDSRKIFLGMVRDVTEQVEARRRLEEMNAELEQRVHDRTQALGATSRQLQSIMDTLADGITMTDESGRLLQANPAAREMLGLGPEHFGKPLSEQALHALAAGQTMTLRDRRKTEDGRELTLLITHSPRRNEQGASDGLVSIYRDISEAEQAERRVQHVVDSLERAEKLARIGSWTLHLDTGAFDSSAMMYELNGVTQDMPISVHDLQRMMPEEDFARVGAAIQICAAEGTPYTVDVTHYIPGGGKFAAEIRGRAMRDHEGRIFAITGTVQDVSGRVAMQEQLSAIADSLPNGAIYRIDFLDPHLGEDDKSVSRDTLQFSYVSAGIHKLLGFSAEELMVSPGRLMERIHPEDAVPFLEASRRATADQKNFEFDFRLTKEDGELAWLQVRSAPRVVDGRRVWDGIILDVTAAYETAEALRRAKEDAESAERAKSGFLATMSHEIRTPMNSVIGMTRLALQTDLSPRQRNYLDKIDTSARALLGLINDILDFSRIEAGGLQLENTEFALDSVLETVSNATSLRAEEKGLEVIYAVAPEVPWLLRGDPLRLGQVLINLVGNAIKFTDRGEVKVSVSRITDQHTLRFEIRDTGIGMDDEQLATLFRPFSQTSSRTARYYGGTGLGLSISKQLVQLMGGEIDVTSQPSFGSCFSFVVPLVDPVERVARSLTAFKGRRALIVDDSATARAALGEMLDNLGFDFETVGSGAEALARLRQRAAMDEPIDLVLMDWRMPGMDGVETARQIRSDRNLRKIPAVLMVTAHAREEVLRHVEQLDLQGLLIKPVTESMMVDAVQQIFSRRCAGSDADRHGMVAADLPAVLRGKSVLIVDDNLFNLEVASDFLDLAGMEVQTAVSGQEALDLLARRKYDVVLMDMQMPDLDGVETTRRIRLIPDLRDLPVIALTAQARIEDREATQEVGMAEHLTKPIDENLMFTTLARVLSAAAPASAALLESQASGPAPIDIDQMLARMRGDCGRVKRTLEMFLRDFSICPEEARKALAAGDRAGLAAVAHRIRGTAGYLGAVTLKEIGDRLEHLARDASEPPIEDEAAVFVAELESVLLECRIARESQFA